MARDINARIKWFMTNLPGRAGRCLEHTHTAIDLPPAGMATANDAVSYLRSEGHLYQGNPPRGSMVLWTSPVSGHASLSLGLKRKRFWNKRVWMIASTDVKGPNTVGRVPLSYIAQEWGYTYAGWSDWYAGEFYEVGRKVALSDKDVNRIADAVWEKKLDADPSTPAKEPKKAGWLLGKIHQNTKK